MTELLRLKQKKSVGEYHWFNNYKIESKWQISFKLISWWVKEGNTVGEYHWFNNYKIESKWQISFKLLSWWVKEGNTDDDPIIRHVSSWLLLEVFSNFLPNPIENLEENWTKRSWVVRF